MRKCEKQRGWTSSMRRTCLHLSVILATFPSSVSWTLTLVFSSTVRWLPVSMEPCERGFLQSMNFALTGQSEPILMIRCHVLVGLNINCPSRTEVTWVRTSLPKPLAAVPWEGGRTDLQEASSVQFSCSVVSDSLQPRGLQHARLLCPLPTPRAYSNSCPLCQWCHPTISSCVIPFSSCPQSFLASGSYQMSQLFTSGGQIFRVSTSASLLPVNIQDWFPLGWASWISLKSKGLSRVISNTQKHQYIGAQLSSQSSSHIHTWLLENL